MQDTMEEVTVLGTTYIHEPQLDGSVTFYVDGNGVLTIDLLGMIYQGVRVEDAGEAYKAWMEVMGKMQEIHSPTFDGFMENEDAG